MIKKTFILFSFLFSFFYSSFVFACNEVFNYSDMTTSDPLYSLFMSNCSANTYTMSFFGNITSFCNTAESLEDFNNNAGTPVNVLITTCTTACSNTDPLLLRFSLDDLPSPLTVNIDGCGYTLSDLTVCAGGDDNWFCSSTGIPTGQPAQPSDYTPSTSTTFPLPDTPPNAPPNPTTTKLTTPLITGTNPLGEPTTELTTTEETATPPRNDVVIEDATIEIITASGTRVRKITKTTTTMKANGSIRRETTVEYSQASQTTTTISVPKNPALSPTTTSSTIDGTSGTTTEITTTNPDGSSTTESSSTGDGEPDEFPEIQEKGNNQFDSYLDNVGITEMADGLGSDDPGLFSFSSPMSNMSSGCQSITTNFGNKVFTFPGNDGCQRLEQLKDIFAFVLYVLTAYSIFEIAIRRPV